MLTLYGGERSPFARRVAIWLAFQNRPFIRRPADLFGADFVSMRQRNPVSRVPVLELETGECLVETFAIIDHLEDTAPPGMRLIPATGPDRRATMQLIAEANSITEKAVALVYETERRPPEFVWDKWRERLVAQIESGVAALDAKLPAERWLGGDRPDGADIAVHTLSVFLPTIAEPEFLAGRPGFAAHAARAAAEPRFAGAPVPTPGA